MNKYTHTCIYIHIYISTHIHTYPYIHTHIQNVYARKHGWNDGAAANVQGAVADQGSFALLFCWTHWQSNHILHLQYKDFIIPTSCSTNAPPAVHQSRSTRARRNPNPRMMIKVTVHEKRRVNEEQPTSASLSSLSRKSRQRGAQSTPAHLHWCGANPSSSWPTMSETPKSMLQSHFHHFPAGFPICTRSADLLLWSMDGYHSLNNVKVPGERSSTSQTSQFVWDICFHHQSMTLLPPKKLLTTRSPHCRLCCFPCLRLSFLFNSAPCTILNKNVEFTRWLHRHMNRIGRAYPTVHSFNCLLSQRWISPIPPALILNKISSCFQWQFIHWQQGSWVF